jgi:HlyD family secretion protein
MSATMFLGRVVLPGVGLLLAAVLAWRSVRNITAPADEAAHGHPSAATSRAPGWIITEGRVVAYPGAQVTVGTEVLATIINMPVREKESVHKGDLLVELRADEVRASLREAHHRLTEAEVALRLEQTRSRLDRILPLVTGKESQSQDARRELLASALAHRDAAKAAVDRLDAEAAKYHIVAPIDGVVVVRHANPGETVSPASPLVTIVDLTRLRIEAQVDEFDIASVVALAPAWITAEGYPGHRWRGEVVEIADAVVPRQSRPEDPGRPADTGVLLVKVAFREICPLKLQQRVEVEIDVRQRDHPGKAPREQSR